ncbi:MAG: hypothetical protein DCF25_13470 [Leptolyngbya foveolarum]|uniref:Toxin-antitoxin system HicB family antitoxin n=1 Tax=Leptolyngbya foveolarum TaxID=47253 RepID=A0A2W4W943_9CYAN|nr:MAG: hypothetical protein DCF25_13470 [Leptolyngbya foveolarum]
MTNTISHRGYVGQVTIDVEDNCLYAQLINAPKVHFTCEGQTVSELVKSFSSWIDDYIAGFSEAGLDVVQPQVLAAA